MAKRGRKSKGKKRKAVKVQFIERVHVGKVVECYAIAEQIITEQRTDLKNITIGFAWHSGWRPDADGLLKLGCCKKRAELDRELDKYDFVILLNKDAWKTFEAKHKMRLIFHELEHAQICLDKNGEPMKDERGRFVCRIRKHDFEEFRSVLAQYGLDDDLSKIAKAGINDADRPLLQGPGKDGMKNMAKTVAAEEKKHTEKNKKQHKVKDLNNSSKE